MQIKELQLKELVPHEEINEDRVSEVMYSLRNGQIEPILVDKNYGVVLDGHHRVEAARRLGWNMIQCNIVDYDNEVNLDFWNAEVRCSKCDVILLALSGYKFPPKTTKHTLCINCAENDK